MERERPSPPRPDLVRRPPSAFGWLDARLLHDGWLARLGPEATAVLVLLAIAADPHGASFYGRARMAAALSLARPALDRALQHLLDLGLVAHRPWRRDHPDGVWQLLPLSTCARRDTRPTQPVSLGDVIRNSTFPPPAAT